MRLDKYLKVSRIIKRRTVANDACVVVDEGRTVNPSHGIYAEHDIDTVRFQQLPKLFPCIVRAHGVFDCLPQPVECPVLLQRALRQIGRASCRERV